MIVIMQTKKLTKMTRSLIIALPAQLVMIFLLAIVSFSQVEKEWIKFNSPSKNFTIELPELPIQETKIAKKVHGKEVDAEFSIFKCSKSINYYRLPSLINSGKYRLIIREIDITACKRKSNDYEDNITNFLKTILGNPTISRDKSFVENNLQYRRISYESGEYYTKDSPKYNRLVAVNAGKKVFILIYNQTEGYEDYFEIFRSFTTKYENNELITPASFR